MSRHRHRLDANHHAIRECAEALGWHWQDTSQTGLGYDAILIRGGVVKFCEIKDGMKPISQQRLTPYEQRVHQDLKAHGVTVEVLTSQDDLVMLGREQRARRDG